MGLQVTPLRKLSVVIGISFTFFVVEISIGFKTHSLALIADAFHYLNDLIGFIVALVAIIISQRDDFPKEFSFGWQRAHLLGAFFNGVTLATLGLSIFLQAIERFISLQRVEQPELVLIVGGIGLCLNLISATFLHEHSHGHSHQTDSTVKRNSDPPPNVLEAARLSFDTVGAGVHASHNHIRNPYSKRKSRDLGTLGVFLHVICDAVNNVGVMAVAAVIWWGKSETRFYADPAVGLGISFMIIASSVPLVKNSGLILLQSAPSGLHVEVVKKDLEGLPGISSVHELHIWQLDQQKTIASAHIVVESNSVNKFMQQAQQIGECLHAYGIHSFTVQPELSRNESVGLHTQNEIELSTIEVGPTNSVVGRVICKIKCQEGGCEAPQCCD